MVINSKSESKSEVAQSCLTLCDPVDCSRSGFSVHSILQARILELPFFSPGYLPDPGIEPGSPALEEDALTSEPLIGFLVCCLFVLIRCIGIEL